MLQLILHLWGDYVLQSSWMAENKTKAWWPAIVHATVYSLPYLLIGSPAAVLVICSTHAIIDRYRLARFVCWLKNRLAPRATRERYEERISDGEDAYAVVKGYRVSVWWHSWAECSATGYNKDVPVWLSTWLLIITDNTLHLTINYLALAHL